MSTPRTVALHTLGCKLNYSETSSIQRLFERSGYAVCDIEEPADVYVINTCSVTEFADKKCRQLVRKVHRHNPDACIVVTGCYAQLQPEEIASIPGVSLVLGAGEKMRILDYVDQFQSAHAMPAMHVGAIQDVRTFDHSFSIGDRTRTFLKVQDGCDYKCSFCTIPKARGGSRSDTIENVLNNICEISNSGTKEIVLTGINLGDYGNGTEIIEGKLPKKNALFIDLIKAIDTETDIVRVRISSIEPNLLTDEIIEFVANSQRFMPHFHVPLQSGSDTILKAMRRRYVSALYRERVEHIKKCMPHACIGVDVIVGFPGETDAEFRTTCDFLNSLDISYLHVFTYSERPNTPAIELGGVVPMEVRRQRNEVLRLLSEKKKQHFYAEHFGTTRKVLIEQSNSEDFAEGFTDNYIRVQVPGVQFPMNSIQEILITRHTQQMANIWS